VWYEVVLGTRSRKPDFMVLNPQSGVIILEVKDWAIEITIEASEKGVRLKGNHGSHIDQNNPVGKCKVYLEEAMQPLELESVLVGERDRLQFPLD
jgi:hypothetical protein